MWFSFPRVATSDALRLDDGLDVPARGAGAGVRPAVVRPLAGPAERLCARPSCSTRASATLGFDYAGRQASIEVLQDEPRPQTYDLCTVHATRTTPPNGWQLHDHRPMDERFDDLPTATPADLGGDRTVAVLAAALRAVPDPVSEDAVSHGFDEVGPAVARPIGTTTAAAVDRPSGPRPVRAARERDGGGQAPTLWSSSMRPS